MSSVIEPVEGRPRAERRKGLILLATLGYQILPHCADSSDHGSSLGEFLSIAPLAVWAVFANLLTVPLVVALFPAGYLYRILRYPDFSQASMRPTVRAYHQYGGSGPAPVR